MNEFLDLLPIPAERDFPLGQLEARREAVVAAIHADAANEPFARRAMRIARGHITKTWPSVLGILTLGLTLLAIGVSGQQRPSQRDAAVLLAVTGTAQIAVAGWKSSVAPRAR
jgi:hypothetical protein